MRKALVILSVVGLLLSVALMHQSSSRKIVRLVHYHETGRLFGSPGGVRRPLPREQMPIYYEAGAETVLPRQGTAFAVANTGGWATAAHVTDRCAHLHFMISQHASPPTPTYLRMSGKDVSVIHGGVDAPRGFDLEWDRVPGGSTAYAMGFPMGTPSVIGTRLLGPTNAVRRGGASEKVLVWVQDWRTPDQRQELDGLSGGPMLGERGEVTGVVSMANERRGRIITSMPDVIPRLIAGAAVEIRPPAEEAIADRADAIAKFQQFLREGLIREVYCDVN